MELINRNRTYSPPEVRQVFDPSCRRNRVVASSTIDDYKRFFMKCAYDECPGFLFTDSNREAIADIFRWCMMLDGNLDPEKGLWLWGNIGTGKSTMLRIVKRFCNKVRPNDCEGNDYSFSIFPAADICAGYSEKGYPGIEKYFKSRRLAIDELGREPLESGHYGNTVNVMCQLLQSRYDNRHTHFTHVTSNLLYSDNPREDEVASRYGAHIYDRCKEMFNFVRMTGKTFRK